MAKIGTVTEMHQAETIWVNLGERTYAERQEMVTWLQEPNRPGLFMVKPFWLKTKIDTDFFITDPNVAFEFRMRWS